MRALSLLCLLACISPPLLAADLDGRYQGTLDERPVELVLRSQGQQVEGEYIEDQQRFRVSGHFDGQALQVQILSLIHI